MKTDLLDYDLPQSMIAQYPVEVRGRSKLLVMDKNTGKLEHKRYFDIPEYVKKGDVIVLNKTKVIWARIFPTIKRTGRKVQMLFLKRIERDRWYCLFGRAKYIKNEDELTLGGHKMFVRDRKSGEAGFVVEIKNAEKIMEKYGHVPLPPYIKRDDVKDDKDRYNTVFAKNEESVAAPTASLNLTKKIIKGIKRKGAKVCFVNLGVSWGTFAPLNTEKIEDFKIHPERVFIGTDTVEAVNNCKGRVWAFGTTVVRALEGAAVGEGRIKRFDGDTGIFIFPGYKFKIVDILVTNFHAPKTSLLALVCAFAGRRNILKVYEVAKSEGYRFLSYGDSMLIA